MRLGPTLRPEVDCAKEPLIVASGLSKEAKLWAGETGIAKEKVRVQVSKSPNLLLPKGKAADPIRGNHWPSASPTRAARCAINLDMGSVNVQKIRTAKWQPLSVKRILTILGAAVASICWMIFQ